MKRNRRRSESHEPSLVPMADMLTNTVGIMIFILIFIVLAAEGASASKDASEGEVADVESVLEGIEEEVPFLTKELQALREVAMELQDQNQQQQTERASE